MSLKWPPKDPDEVLDYEIDWSARLDTDTIATSTWIVPDGLTEERDDKDNTSTTIWLSGGATGQNYSLTNRIVTAAGRTMDQTVVLSIRDK